MATRVEDAAARFEAANGALIAAVEACGDEPWGQPCSNEERTIGVVAQHVAVVYPAFAHIVSRFVAGETYSPGSGMEQVNEHNAQEAHDNAGVDKSNVRELLRTNGAEVARQLRSLGDEQFDQIAGNFGGNELLVSQVVDYVVIGHTLEHLASIRGTLGA